MSVDLTQPDYSQSKADPSATKVVTWIRSDGTRVLVNEDNPLPVTSSTVNDVKVVGIQEVDNYQVGLTAGTTTVPAGALSISLATSSDFAGTVQGAAVSGTKSISRTAQPGNVCPAFVVTRSSGTYDIYVVTAV